MRRLWLLIMFAAAGPLGARGTAHAVQAAEVTISAQDVAHHVAVLAHDSMMGRYMPSRGLEMTAQYIADQFQKAGLTPGGINESWFQRYPVPPLLNAARSRVVFSAGGKQAAATFATAAHIASSTIPSQPVTGTPVLLSGYHTYESLMEEGDLSGRMVLYVVPRGAKPDVLEALATMSPAVIVLPAQDSAEFTKRLRINRENTLGVGGSWGIGVLPDAVDGLREVFAAAGVDLAKVRADTAPMLRELPSLQISLDLQFDRAITQATAPNVVGILPGSDPKLKDQYIVIVAHMDHLGVTPNQADSINNGVDDNASGAAGLIELAKVFSQSGTRPGRSIIFLATSGGAQDLSGSKLFVSGGGIWGGGGTIFVVAGSWTQVQLVSEDTTGASASPGIVGAINLDRIGRNTGDSIMVNGLSEVELATSLEWVMAAHPEFGLRLVDGGTVFRPESDHFAFARARIPTLYFHSGVRGDSHQVADSTSTIDAEREARILRFIFHVGQQIANDTARPRWTTEGRRGYLSIGGN